MSAAGPRDFISVSFYYSLSDYTEKLEPCSQYHREGTWFVQDFADGRQEWHQTASHDNHHAVTKIIIEYIKE